MIYDGQFDRAIGAMVRDPENADKTATEILAEHRRELEESLLDDEYGDISDRIMATLAVIGIIVGVAIWAILSYS